MNSTDVVGGIEQDKGAEVEARVAVLDGCLDSRSPSLRNLNRQADALRTQIRERNRAIGFADPTSRQSGTALTGQLAESEALEVRAKLNPAGLYLCAVIAGGRAHRRQPAAALSGGLRRTGPAAVPALSEGHPERRTDLSGACANLGNRCAHRLCRAGSHRVSGSMTTVLKTQFRVLSALVLYCGRRGPPSAHRRPAMSGPSSRHPRVRPSS